MRVISDAEYCHEHLGDEFATALSDYDTKRRVEVLVEKFLADAAVPGTNALDVGCGLGFFSQSLHARGVDVVACDLGPNLVEHTRSQVGCESVVADALNLVEQFGTNKFDMVVSSECVEHTPAPYEAVKQMAGVLKQGGLLSISTPNIVWQPVVQTATRMKLRPFDGYENFSSWTGLRRTLDECGVDIVSEYGLHLIPFQFRLHRLSRWLDRYVQPMRLCMINICILGRKRLDHVKGSSCDNVSGKFEDAQSRVA
jgi:2-polyprenyl-3-methyl-5-hydroxy-6-metoxy-1,4-benzoquinol methylase